MECVLEQLRAGGGNPARLTGLIMSRNKSFPAAGRRWLIAGGVILVILALAWTGGWFWLARWAEENASHAFARLAEEGVAVDCAERSIVGFPFALKLACGKTAVAEARTGTRADFAGLNGGASLFSPATARVSLVSPARIDSTLLDGAAEMRWDSAAIGVGLGVNGPRDLSFDASELAAKLSGLPLPIDGISAASAEGSLAPSPEGGSDVSLAFSDLGVSMAGAELPPVSGSAAAELSVPPRALATGRASLQAPVWARNIDVALQSSGAAFQAAGDIAIDAEGILDGELTLKIAGAEALPGLIAKLPQDWQRKANGAVGGIFLFGTPTTLDGKTASELKVKIERSAVSIGDMQLITLPHIRL